MALLSKFSNFSSLSTYWCPWVVFFLRLQPYKCRVHSIFCFLVKVTKNEKHQLSFSGKLRIFIQKINKQNSFFFVFLVTVTKQRKTKNGLNRAKVDKNFILFFQKSEWYKCRAYYSKNVEWFTLWSVHKHQISPP